MSQLRQLSRAELRVWCLKVQGWRFIERRVIFTSPFREVSRVYAWSPYELEALDWSREGEDRTAVINSYLGILEWQSTQPDPTRNISEAWNLVELVTDPSTKGFHEVLTPGALFLAAWSEHPQLCCKSEEEAATWICLTAYWVIEGERVELKED